MKIQGMIRLRPLLAMPRPVIAFILQWMFWADIQPFAWLLFIPSVFASAWIGGFIPELASTFLSALIANWFFIHIRLENAIADDCAPLTNARPSHVQ